MKRSVGIVTVLGTVLVACLAAVILVCLGGLLGFALKPTAASTGPAVGPAAQTQPQVQPDRRDFLFQVNGYQTKNQGGQTINLYFHYRYDQGIAEDKIPNYEDLRTQALTYLDGIDTKANPYWETLAKTLCTGLKTTFPIEAISCQLQVFPDNRPGLPYEPGYHGTIYTIGDIEALAVPGPISQRQ